MVDQSGKTKESQFITLGKLFGDAYSFNHKTWIWKYQVLVLLQLSWNQQKRFVSENKADKIFFLKYGLMFSLLGLWFTNLTRIDIPFYMTWHLESLPICEESLKKQLNPMNYILIFLWLIFLSSLLSGELYHTIFDWLI